MPLLTCEGGIKILSGFRSLSTTRFLQELLGDVFQKKYENKNKTKQRDA
jgi:hypothetical protein